MIRRSAPWAAGLSFLVFACGGDDDVGAPDESGTGSSSGAEPSGSSGAGGSSSGSTSSSGGSSSGTSTTAPTVAVLSPRDGASVASYRVLVHGTASDDVAVTKLHYTLNGGAATNAELGEGSFDLELVPVPGDNVLVVTAEDAAGQHTDVTSHFWYGHRLSAGNSQAVLLANDQVFTWGRNERGQLGNGTTNGTWSADETATVPARFTVDVAPLAAVVTRQTFMLGLGVDGTVYSWGDNQSGQLGRETALDCGGTACGKTPVAVPGLTEVVAIDAGFDHSLVLTKAGTVLGFGDNGVGQLGTDDAAPRRTPAPVPGLVDIVQVAAGAEHSMALTRDGHVLVWGSNQHGQLGLGTADDDAHHEPVQIAGIDDAVAIASANFTPMVLLADGTVRAWGQNANGQVGSGVVSDDDVLAPTTVLAAAGQPLTGIESLAADGFVGVAVDHAGLTHTWGFGFLGQTGRGLLPGGDRNLDDQPFAGPVVVPDGAAAGSFVALETEVGAGGPAFVLTTQGEVYGWGWSFRGSLGGGTTMLNAWAYTSPVLIYQP